MRLMQPSKHEKGNVFVFILLGIFLFGALIFTFTRSGQQGNSALTKQQAKLAAQDILNTSRLIEQGLQKLLAKGCSEKQISFFSPANLWYSVGNNLSAPADRSCHLFDNAGAGLIQTQVPASYLTSNIFAAGMWPHDEQHEGDDFCYDIFLTVKYLKPEICNELNRQLKNGLPTPPPLEFGNDSGLNYSNFGKCTVAATEPQIDNVALVGLNGFCVHAGGDRYDFYYLLHKH